jgi:hypothetical protein
MRRTIPAALLALALAGLTAHADDPLQFNVVAGGPFYPGIPGPPGISHRAIGFGDFDSDGDNDVMVTEVNSSLNGNFRLMKNSGNGALTFAGAFGFTKGAYRIATGDFNNDGKMDAAAPNAGALPSASGGIDVVYGNGAGGFTSGFIPSGPISGLGPPGSLTHLSPIDITTGDWNGDGRTDLAVAALTSSTHQVFVVTNNGNGSFSTGAAGATAAVTGIASGDLNGDGDLDLAVSSSTNVVRFYFGQGGSSFTQNSFHAVGTPSALGSPTRIAVGDVDGDGDRDVVTRHNNGIAVMLNNGGGTFTAADTIDPVGFGDTADLKIGDLDGAGGVEIVTGSGGALNMFRYDGSSDTISHVSGSPFAVGSWNVGIGQMNNAASPLDLVSGVASSGLNVLINGPADATPPEFGNVDDVTAEATGPDGATVEYTTPSATDDVDGDVEVSCEPASGTQFDLGATTVTCTAEDEAGNDSDVSFDVIVEDTTGASVDPVDDIVAEATGPNGATVDFDAPPADDLVDGALATTCLPAGGSTFDLGMTTVTCSVEDAAGNEGASSFIVTVEDSTAPQVTAPADITAELTGPGGAAVGFGGATATDAVGVTSGPACDAQSGATFTLGAHLVTCTAGDAAGHSASDSFTITVVDTTPPSLTLPGPVAAPQSSCAGTPVTIAASASDLSGVVTLQSDAPAVYPLGTTVVTFTATDGSGNINTGTVSVTVVDQTVPVIVAAAASQTSLWPPNGRMESIDVTWSVDDCDIGASCSIVSVSSSEPAAAGDWSIVDADTVQLRARRNGNGNGRVYTITIRCTDAAGNSSTRTVTVTVPHDQGRK